MSQDPTIEDIADVLPDKVERTFTQEELNRIAAKERDRGMRNALRSLGIDDSDNNVIESAKAILANGFSKNSVQAPSASIDLVRKIDETNEKLFRSELKAELLAEGMKKQYIDDALILLNANRNAKQEDFSIDESIKSLKERHPNMFSAVEELPKIVTGGNGTGTIPNAGNADTAVQDTVGSYGARIAGVIPQSNAPESRRWM